MSEQLHVHKGGDQDQFMTTDDVENGCPQYYHAFVCYNPDGADLRFVKDLVNKLESEPYNLKLCVPGRNDLPGGPTHTISASLIKDRCRKMLIIMSPRYLQSEICEFQTNFAASLSLRARSMRLVPCLIEDCQIPNVLIPIGMCDYTRTNILDWTWDRLVFSLMGSLDSTEWERSRSEPSLRLLPTFNQINNS
ncbi:myeloid differentiation primary response protein MyD88-like [Patella vulgata]|uniref:myeloid differentiation primary response protein MyD88-like n=1 Tax=Patella vulgata TaxID=6465 RepID=UPI0024A8B4B5|nr:myeloid differentiation primary response protein MyD88-like [Patella vulgata]